MFNWNLDRRVALAAGVVVCAGLLVSSAHAVPSTFTYAGDLYAENDLPYNGDVDVEVALFGSASGGEALWSQPGMTVTVVRGVLVVDMMDSGLAGLFGQTDSVWAEFTIDGEVLSPRQRFTSVPYAAVAGNAQTLNGQTADSFLPSGEPVASENLPTNGIGQISNGSLNNEFADVTWSWEDEDQAIVDAPAEGSTAMVTTSETGDSYLTSLTIFTSYSLDFINEIEMVLFPPPSSGIGPITLFSGIASAGPTNEMWSPGNTPALQDLIGVKVEGDWTLVITDTDDNAAPGVTVGQLSGFDIIYDVVRSDQLQVGGQLDVAGDINTTGDIAAGGDIAAQGEVSAGGVGDFKFIGLTSSCSVHQQSNDFQTYCLDQTTVNTAAGFLSINTNGEITVQRAGYYNVNFHAWQRSDCGRMDTRLRKNGGDIRGTEHRRPNGNEGVINFSEITRYEVGDVITVATRTNCNSSNAYAAHLGSFWSRVQVHYMGH